MTATSLVSFQIGWWPPARSMMLSRRIPAVIARTRDSASALREAKATPHMPHTLLFDLRRGEEGGTRTAGIFAQTEARNSQSAVRIPGKQDPQQQKEQCRRTVENEIEERFTFQEEAPVDRFIPSRINAVQQAPQMQTFERQPRQPHMRELVVIVLARIIRDGPGGLGKHGGIPQIAACQIAAPGIFHDDPESWIDDDPAVVDQNLRDHMLRSAIGSQEEQSAHSQIGTSRKIQEGVRGCATDVQQLAVGERHLWIALRECVRIPRAGSRWLGAHPV